MNQSTESIEIVDCRQRPVGWEGGRTKFATVIACEEQLQDGDRITCHLPYTGNGPGRDHSYQSWQVTADDYIQAMSEDGLSPRGHSPEDRQKIYRQEKEDPGFSDPRY